MSEAVAIDKWLYNSIEGNDMIKKLAFITCATFAFMALIFATGCGQRGSGAAISHPVSAVPTSSSSVVPAPAPPAAPAAPSNSAEVTGISDKEGIVTVKAANSENKMIRVGSKAPDFVLKDVRDQRTVALKDMRGKVVLVDFWATWCVPCRETTPVLEGLYQRNYDKGLRVVGISLDHPETAANVIDFVNENSVTYSVTSTPWNDYQVALKYKVNPLPSLCLIDRKGVVRWTMSGYSEEEWRLLEHNIKYLLSES
jgi:thiol-disulfide isomerase/thioredoxin